MAIPPNTTHPSDPTLDPGKEPDSWMPAPGTDPGGAGYGAGWFAPDPNNPGGAWVDKWGNTWVPGSPVAKTPGGGAFTMKMSGGGRLSGAELKAYLDQRARQLAEANGMTLEEFRARYWPDFAKGGDYDAGGNFVGGGLGGYTEDGVFVGTGATGGGGETFEPGGGTGRTGSTPGFNERQNSLMAYVEDLLSQYGLNTPGLLEFARNAIAQGWDSAQIMLELRRHPDYLANPLFAANAKRAKAGGGWMPEAQLIQYASEANRLVNQYGFGRVENTQIANLIESGASLAEFENKLQIQRTVIEFGPAVRMVMEQELGINMTDKDLHEFFDPTKDTNQWTTAFKNALYRGRPAALGLGTRSAAEAARLVELGVDPNEAFQRYSTVAANATRFERLGSIENMLTGKLPDSFGDFLAKTENSLLVRGLVFQDPQALARLQAMSAREIARHNQGGGAVATQGMLTGLLSGAEKQTFG